MGAFTNVKTKLRHLLQDNLASGSDIFTYGASDVFTLTEANVDSVTDVSINDESSGVGYTYDATTNKVQISNSLSAGDIVEVVYSYYQQFSDAELEGYINSSLIHLSINNYYDFSIKTASEVSELYPTPEVKEENLIAMIAAVIAAPDNINYKLPDITVNVGAYMEALPTDKKISRIIAIFKKNSHGVFFITGAQQKIS